MSDEVLWRELLRIAERWRERAEPASYDRAYADVSRSMAICHRLGVEHPGVEMLKKDAFEDAELREFFRQTWRLATLHAEERRVARLEARGGVDADAADLVRLRETLGEARAMILEFAWLAEDQKRRHLEVLETVATDLQRARDAFDVAMDGIDDPARARTIDIGRPGPFAELMRRVLGPLGIKPAQPKALEGPARSLPPPRRDGDEAR